MGHQNKGYCAYNYCEGNHQRINMKYCKTQNAYYLKIALHNSKNKRIVQEKLLKCQEKVKKSTKFDRQSLNENINILPKLNEIDEHGEDLCTNNGTNSEIVSVSTELLVEMFQMQMQIDNILRKFS